MAGVGSGIQRIRALGGLDLVAGAAKEKASGSKEAGPGAADAGGSGGDGTVGSGGGGEDMSLIDDENPAVLAHDESQVSLCVCRGWMYVTGLNPGDPMAILHTCRHEQTPCHAIFDFASEQPGSEGVCLYLCVCVFVSENIYF